MTQWNQNLSPSELQSLWHARNAQIPWLPAHGICSLWMKLVQNHPEIPLGAPMTSEEGFTVDGKKLVKITFESGRQLVYFFESNRTCIF